MERKRIKLSRRTIPLFIIVVVTLGLLLVSCQQEAATVPDPLIKEPPSLLEVPASELNSLYLTDETAADAMFLGKRLTLYEVLVEEVKETLQIDRHGDITVFKEYFTFEGIRFYPNDLAKMQQVEVGYVLNVVGNCRGVHMGYVIIDNSWLEGVGVDLGGGSMPVPY
jgi:hypothetical protein